MTKEDLDGGQNVSLRLPWFLTAAVLLCAVAVYVAVPEMEARSNVGNYVGGFASALAFIWLIAAHVQQGRELRLQRSELSLQRSALDLQRREVNTVLRFGAIEQMTRILEQFDAELQRTSQLLLGQLGQKFLEITPREWKIIQDSKDAATIVEAHVRWLHVYGLCAEFLERVVSAVEFYTEATGERLLPDAGNSGQRIVAAYDKLVRLPFLRHYVASAKTVADMLLMLEPGIDRFMLAGLEATEKFAPGVVREEKLAELREKVARAKGSFGTKGASPQAPAS